MTKFSYGFVVGLLLLASCTNDEVVYEQPVDAGVGVKTFTSFSAALGEAADSRVYIVDGAENGPKKVTWDDLDAIDIFSDVQWDATMYILQDVSDYEGTFVGKEVSGNKFTAVFAPLGWYRDNVNRNKVYFYVGEAIDEDYWDESVHATTVLDFEFYAPMLATSETNNLHFKQLTGLIHFTVTGLEHISYAYLKGNKGEKIQGTFYVDLSNLDGGLQIDDAKDYATQTKVYLHNEPLDEGQTMDVYFALPPTVFEEGFTLGIEGENFDYEDVYYEKVFSDKLVLKAGEVNHFSLVNIVTELDKGRVAKMQEQLAALNDPTTVNALLALYQQTGGAYWKILNGWGRDDQPVEKWEGLIFEDGKLTSIWLTDVNMKGDLPAEIADLKDLSELYLNHNQITSLPEELTKMTNLQELYLRNNDLSGELPALIAQMPNLQVLDLRGNNYEGSIPDSWLNNLDNLIVVLGNNKLTGYITKEQQQSPLWQYLKANLDRFWVDLESNQQKGYGMTIEGRITHAELLQDEIELKVGESVQLEFVILPEGNFSDLTYNNPKPNVISIDENGKVTALAPGEVYIEFKISDDYATYYMECWIDVVAP